MHSFIPPWKMVRGRSVPEEIFVVGHGKDGGSTVDTLFSWRLQLSRVSSSPRASDLEPAWRLFLVSKGRSRSPMLPRNPQTISNAGRMLSFYWGMNSFDLFRDTPQPTTVLKPEDHPLIDYRDSYSIESLDPYSGILAIRTPEKVKIIEFN